jgi:cation diffusion facilitator family transporter
MNSYEAVSGSGARGIWALKVSLAVLVLTATFQVFIVAMSGSVALLADTLHNYSDALTAIPLWIAFALNRRPATRRYPYGYGRAEDLAGIAIVLIMLGSALIVLYESAVKIVNPQPPDHLEWVGVAALISLIGNEAVAVFRLRIGRSIGSAALVADGWHALADGLAALGVLLGVVGVWLGVWWADSAMGLAIGAVILVIVYKAGAEIGRRLMDAADPKVIMKIERTAKSVPGVQRLGAVRTRWAGHRLLSELCVQVDGDLTITQAHSIAEVLRHDLFHELPALSDAIIHLDPPGSATSDPHALTAHHW